MENQDYKELLELLNTNNVRYCIVGAFAVIYYGRPRYTKDMDILIDPEIVNCEKAVKAIKEFGFSSKELNAKNLAEQKKYFELGREPVMIHIMTKIDGIDFNSVWKNKVKSRYGNTATHFIGLNELIKNKEASSRQQDERDLKLLKKAIEKKKSRGFSR